MASNVNYIQMPPVRSQSKEKVSFEQPEQPESTSPTASAALASFAEASATLAEASSAVLESSSDAVRHNLRLRTRNDTAKKDVQRTVERLGHEGSRILQELPDLFDRDIFPQDSVGIIANTVAGVICSIKISLGMAVFASLMWSQCPDLSSHVNVGVQMNYLTAAILLCVYGFVGNIPFGMILCQDIPCLLVGKMGQQLRELVPNEALLPNFMVLVMLQAVLSGLLFWICSDPILNYTSIVQQVPHGIVGGFVASCGAGLWRAAFQMVTGVELQWPIDWGPLMAPWNCGLLIATLAMFILLCHGPSKLRALTSNSRMKSISSLICTLMPIALFYVGIYALGRIPEDARTVGWLPKKIASSTSEPFWNYWSLIELRVVRIDICLSFLPQLVACALLSLLELVFNVTAVEAAMGDVDIDLGKEAQSIGIANMICGLLGGNMGYLQGGMTLVAKQVDNASHRICIFIASCCSMLLFISGLPLADFIPKFVSGAFFLLTGWYFLKKWLLDSFLYMPYGDYLIVWVIVCCSVYWDIPHALGIGMIYATTLHLLQSATADIVKRIDRGDTHKSKKTRAGRSLGEIKVLSQEGHAIVILTCSGFLYWGNAKNIVDCVLLELRQRVDEPRICPRWLILDCYRCCKIDVSAVKAFEKFLGLAARQECKLAICLDKNATDEQMVNTVLLGQCKIYWEGVDKALQDFEDELLGSKELKLVLRTAAKHDSRWRSYGQLSRELVDKLRNHRKTSEEMYEQFDVIIEAGQDPIMHIIITGRVEMQHADKYQWLTDQHKAQWGPYEVCGALDFALDRQTHAKFVAAEATTTIRVGPEAFAELETEKDLLEFQRMLLGTVREANLRHSNSMITDDLA